MGENVADKKAAPGHKLTKEQIDSLKPLLKKRIPVNDGPGCFLCKLIYEDLEKHQKLTDKPEDRCFPETGKYQHLKLEGMI
jgi:hydrogenase maturation factor